MIATVVPRRWGLPLVAVLAGMLAACATRPPQFPEPLRDPNPAPAQDADLVREESNRIVEGPTIAAAPAAEAGTPDAAPRIPEMPNRKPTSLVLDGVPMAAFINVVFGTELGFPLEIEQSVRNR